MRRRTLIAAALAAPAVTATQALAGEEGGSSKVVGQYVDLAPVGLPVVDGGKLRNYVFVSVRLLLASGVDPNKTREKEPYFRDALVRASHRRPFSVPGQWMSIDVNAMKATMLREAAAIVGPGVVTQVVLPNPPTAQKRVGAPRP
ncbi:MAG: hypothetical protein JSR45_07130 [Proteobacteria bacterium]|nr:hypothetical protein [Pseudomonadota bacterium]